MATRFIRALLQMLGLALACIAPALAQPRFAFDATPGVLPKDVVPSRYALTFDLDPARDTFTGKASIDIRVRKAVPAIVIHAHELTAASVTLAGANGERPLSVTPDARAQTWRLVPGDASTIDAGDYTVHVAYTGVVHRSGQGLYRADYTANGKAARMLATQLEARFARSLFPGFDEPVFRAAFEIAVRAPKDYEVVSNMPESGSVADGDAQIHRFPSTPPMPTYLVAVAVGRFDALSDEAQRVPLRILGAEGKRELGRYAMDVTRQVVPFYVAYFGVPYALPKLDQLAVPSTRWGAMEDWGIISYAEPLLLFDPARSGPDTQRAVFSVVAHEVAHQWFGNLVTASSWDEIWLNEAFATWLERKATAHFNPAWQVDLHQRSPIDRAMTRDAGTATRAIRSGPVSESRVFDVFDEITYVKGGAVLSMLEQWIGPEVFRRGLAAYIDSQKYSNATAGDLWHHLSQASGQNVGDVAATWTDQEGFPGVRVSAECIEGRTRVTLTQRRFTAFEAPSTGQLWKIPVRLSRGSDVTTLLLDAERTSRELDGCRDEPVIANAGGAGFYRVEYDPAQLRALGEGFLRLAPADRVTLFSDTFALAQVGRVPIASYLALLAAIPGVDASDRATLFSMASDQLTFLDHAMSGTPAQRRVRTAGRLLFAPELARLGWNPVAGEDAETSKERGLLIAQLARFDDRATIEQATRLFALDESGKAMLDSSIRGSVIEAVGIHANGAQFGQLVKRLKSADSEEDRWLYAQALAGGRNASRANQFLSAALTGIAGPNIASSIPGIVARESPFDQIAYRFTLAHWQQLANLAGTVGSRWLLPNAASNANDVARARRLVADQRSKAGEDGAAPAARIAARIELLSAVKRRDAAALEKALSSWSPAR
jgi:aminopeptidase N